MKLKTVRVATRGSLLAMTQTRLLVADLARLNPDFTFTIVTLTTTGDRVTDRPLSQFRGMGVFVKELEKALLAEEADIAVHSLKDVPVERAEGLALAAFPLRKNPFDVLLTKTGAAFSDLPDGAVIGTSSPRRLIQLQALRQNMRFKDLRGNLDTRLRKLGEGQYDAIIVAAAGMLRLEKTFDEKSVLPLDVCLPAAGQGSLAVECRAQDEEMLKIAATVDDENTRIAVSAERRFLEAIGGGCQTPIGVYATTEGNLLSITGVIGDPDNTRLVRDSAVVDRKDFASAGLTLAEKMIALCKKNNVRIQT
jgi:hydroxymethylbilane synthase